MLADRAGGKVEASSSTDAVVASKAGSFPHFDWLRFVLASAVALDHSGWRLGLSGLAVQTFFALSGWLIGGILLETRSSGLPRFFFNRATRIWIPYLFAVGALYIVALLHEGIKPGFFGYLLHDVTFTHNWFVSFAAEWWKMPLRGTGGHFWTISVEEQFYLAAPLLLILTPWGKRLLPWLFIAAFAFVASWWGFQYLSIILGVTAAIAHRDFGEWYNRWMLALIAAVALAVMLAGNFLVGGVYGVLGPIFGISIVLVAAAEGPRNPLAQRLGGVSYPLYLNHWLGIFAANFFASRLHWPDPLRIFIAYVAAVAVAYVAFRLVDDVVMRNRARHYTPRLGKSLMLTGYALCATGVLVGLALGHQA